MLPLNNFPHSIMFHHFHNDKHPKGQGSIDEMQFETMLDWLSERYNLMGAYEFSEKVKSNTLRRKDICLSFDDALLCQYDIARGILKSRSLSAFFFIYSSPFNGEPDYLEIFRFFRNVYFSDINSFYEEFFLLLHTDDPKIYKKEQDRFERENYLEEFPFYTNEDRWFRYIRDIILDKDKYEKYMLSLMEKHSFDINIATQKLWMTNKNITDLHSDGHIIGLHSYNHPTAMGKLSFGEQELEFEKNMQHLESILGLRSVDSMSHPCGNYNEDTLNILRKMGIKIGFRSSISITEIKSDLEIPREDHANILKAMSL